MPFFDDDPNLPFPDRGDTMMMQCLENKERKVTRRESNKTDDIEGASPKIKYHQWAETRDLFSTVGINRPKHEYLNKPQPSQSLHRDDIEGAKPKKDYISLRNEAIHPFATSSPYSQLRQSYEQGAKNSQLKQSYEQAGRNVPQTYWNRDIVADPVPRYIPSAKEGIDTGKKQIVPARAYQQIPYDLLTIPYATPNYYRRIHRPITKASEISEGVHEFQSRNLNVRDINAPKEPWKRTTNPLEPVYRVDGPDIEDVLWKEKNDTLHRVGGYAAPVCDTSSAKDRNGDISSTNNRSKGDYNTISHLNQVDVTTVNPINGDISVHKNVNPHVMHRKAHRVPDLGRDTNTLTTSANIAREDGSYSEMREKNTIPQYVVPRELSLRQAHSHPYSVDNMKDSNDAVISYSQDDLGSVKHQGIRNGSQQSSKTDWDHRNGDRDNHFADCDNHATDRDNRNGLQPYEYPDKVSKYTAGSVSSNFNLENLWRHNKTGRMVQMEDYIQAGPETTFDPQDPIPKSDYNKRLNGTSTVRRNREEHYRDNMEYMRETNGQDNQRHKDGNAHADPPSPRRVEDQKNRDELNRFVHDTHVQCSIRNLPFSQSDSISPNDRASVRVHGHMGNQGGNFSFLKNAGSHMMRNYGQDSEESRVIGQRNSPQRNTREEDADAAGAAGKRIDGDQRLNWSENATAHKSCSRNITGHDDRHDGDGERDRRDRLRGRRDGCGLLDQENRGYAGLQSPLQARQKSPGDRNQSSISDVRNPYRKTAAKMPSAMQKLMLENEITCIGSLRHDELLHDTPGNDPQSPYRRNLESQVFSEELASEKSGQNSGRNGNGQYAKDVAFAKPKKCHTIIGHRTVYDEPGVNKITGRQVVQVNNLGDKLSKGENIKTIVGTNTNLEEPYRLESVDRRARDNTHINRGHETNRGHGGAFLGNIKHAGGNPSYTSKDNPFGNSHNIGPIPLNQPKKWFFDRHCSSNHYTDPLDVSDIAQSEVKLGAKRLKDIQSHSRNTDVRDISKTSPRTVFGAMLLKDVVKHDRNVSVRDIQGATPRKLYQI